MIKSLILQNQDAPINKTVIQDIKLYSLALSIKFEKIKGGPFKILVMIKKWEDILYDFGFFL
ncbi:hypothetical protein AAHH67_31425 [Niallia circulans]